jgi:CRISPR-associated protein Cmr1
MQNAQDEASIWLAGGKGESKKVFSFKDPARTFGFVNGGSVTHDTMRKKLSDVWEDTGQWEFITGEEILRRLMRQLEDR